MVAVIVGLTFAGIELRQLRDGQESQAVLQLFQTVQTPEYVRGANVILALPDGLPPDELRARMQGPDGDLMQQVRLTFEGLGVMVYRGDVSRSPGSRSMMDPLCAGKTPGWARSGTFRSAKRRQPLSRYTQYERAKKPCDIRLEGTLMRGVTNLLYTIPILLLSVLQLEAQETPLRAAYPLGAGPMILYDTSRWNPPLNAGRYQAVAELLRADGYQIEGGALRLDPMTLSRYSVLMMVTPYADDPRGDAIAAARPVFLEAEVTILESWVQSGGRLLLVVGHQPNGAATANLARRFGVELRNGTAMDATPANNWIEGDKGCLGCLKFTVENTLLRSHPITSGRDSTERVESVISAAGQSMRLMESGSVLLAMGPAAFDDVEGDTIPASGRAQGIALLYGAGRVVVLGDGSILSGFAYGPENPRFRRWWPEDPHNRQFTLNVLHWLTGLLEER